MGQTCNIVCTLLLYLVCVCVCVCVCVYVPGVVSFLGNAGAVCVNRQGEGEDTKCRAETEDN